MSDAQVERRFADAWARACAYWAVADPEACAALAGCDVSLAGVTVPLFGRPHLVTHPGGVVSAGGSPVHVAAGILLLHYLLHADGTPPAGEWRAFRELPDGLFYAASFAERSEAPLAKAFGVAGGLEALGTAAAAAGGRPLELADAAYAFQALPRLCSRRAGVGGRRRVPRPGEHGV